MILEVKACDSRTRRREIHVSVKLSRYGAGWIRSNYGLSPFVAAIHCFKLSFSQKFFRSKGVYWWNSLPHELLERSTSYDLFKRHLYGHYCLHYDYLD